MSPGFYLAAVVMAGLGGAFAVTASFAWYMRDEYVFAVHSALGAVACVALLIELNFNYR